MVDGGDEFGDAPKYAACESLGVQITKETLNHVQPRCRGRREVHMKSPVLCQPGLHAGMLVRGIVVADEVQLLVLGRFAVNAAQEREPLLVTVTLLTTANERSVQRIECREQRRRAMALVVMGHARRAPFLQRQTRLGAVESLDLAFFVTAQHQSVFGRIQV